MSTAIRRIRSPCCARAASGHAAAAPPSSVMNSRRFIRSPRRREREASAAQSADAIKVVRKLLTKSAPHLGQCLLACGLVTSAIGCTRTRHGLPDSINRLSRYFAHPFHVRLRPAACLSLHAAWNRSLSGPFDGDGSVVLVLSQELLAQACGFSRVVSWRRHDEPVRSKNGRAYVVAEDPKPTSPPTARGHAAKK